MHEICAETNGQSTGTFLAGLIAHVGDITADVVAQSQHVHSVLAALTLDRQVEGGQLHELNGVKFELRE